VAGLAAAIGRGAMSNPLRDMEKPDVIFAIGTNMTECHPVAATRLKRAVHRGAKLIVADPRRIPLAELADLYLPIRVGSDVALLLAMAHVIARDGLVDREFVEARTQKFDEFLRHVQQFPPEWAAPITGVPAADIETAARWYGAAERGAIYYTLGITEHICGVDNVQSLCNLALMTGNLGREGTGINPMRGQNNIQGSGDSGGIPANFPGFQAVTKPEFQAKFEKLYGKKVDLEKGITKVRALQLATEGKMKAMLVCGENTVVSDPDRDHCQHALESLDWFVVIDIFPTETAMLADVVLPATAWGETDGTYTNTERRVQKVRAAVPPAGDARPEWWIVAEIAKRAGVPGFDRWQSAKDVFEELCSLSPIYHGLSWDRIDKGEYQWPVPNAEHPGTPILHVGEFVNGRGSFSIIGYRDPAEVIDDEYPIWLTTGRRLEAYHTRTMTGRSAGIDYLLPHEELEVHPDDLARLGLADGGWARMTSRRGFVDIQVRADDTSPRGTVFCSFSFNDVPVNKLTGSGYDPVTDTAELKVCPVRVEPLPVPVG
jgi:predicted molibdopterin-dependent oxidoreductase YjgC